MGRLPWSLRCLALHLQGGQGGQNNTGSVAILGFKPCSFSVHVTMLHKCSKGTDI